MRITINQLTIVEVNREPRVNVTVKRRRSCDPSRNVLPDTNGMAATTKEILDVLNNSLTPWARSVHGHPPNNPLLVSKNLTMEKGLEEVLDSWGEL